MDGKLSIPNRSQERDIAAIRVWEAAGVRSPFQASLVALTPHLLGLSGTGRIRGGGNAVGLGHGVTDLIVGSECDRIADDCARIPENGTAQKEGSFSLPNHVSAVLQAVRPRPHRPFAFR